MSDLILGIDAGNFRTKVAGVYGVISFSSAICEWFHRDFNEVFGEDDMEFSIAGRKGFAGTIAEYEDVYDGETSMYGDSKAHEDTKVKTLLAIHRYLVKFYPLAQSVSIVVGQPIKQHKPKDKEYIQTMLEGFHEYMVNGVYQSIRIENVGVVAEGAGAFWSNPSAGTVRIIDVGSGTVNAASIINKKHVNRASDTFNFGMETGKDKQNLESMIRGVTRGTTRLGWNKDDAVYICGGIAENIAKLIKSHYHRAEVIHPILKSYDGVSVVNPTYANSIGFYEIGKSVFSD